MRYKIVLDDEEEKIFMRYMSDQKMLHKAEACRDLIKLGSTNDFDQKQIDVITSVVRSELDDALNGHSNRIKSIVYKTGIFSTTSTFFLIGLLRDMITGERKKNVEMLYEASSKYAVKELKKNG